MALPGESQTYSSGEIDGPPDLRFIHYNDVYHLEQGSKDPVGGIPRFQTVCSHYQNDAQFSDQPTCMTFFSGDCFSPSLESSVTKGKHMIPALNAVNTTVACLGNHDLDFGVDQFQLLAGQCNFPWLCANVLDPALGKNVPLGNCQRSVLLTSSNGIKIGVMGLVEKEWLDTINSLPPNLDFQEPSLVATEIAADLRQQGAELVIALTHQRQPNDQRLARELKAGTIDIILSGHDHIYAHEIVNGTHVLRSGTDYRQLSYIEAWRSLREDASKEWKFNIKRHDVVAAITPDPDAVKMVERLSNNLKSKLEKHIAFTAVPLDARFSTVRQKESNLGNFVADIMRLHYNADAALMAAGTIRGDQIYPPGVIRTKDVLECFPFEDPCVVIGVKGKDLLSALENSVSKYPALEGRFPQVSNIKFTFDPSKPEGTRIISVDVGNEKLGMEREYTLVTRDYMVRGKDGFQSLMIKELGGPARSIIDEESGILISTLLRQYFASIKTLNSWVGNSLQKHWNDVHKDLHEVHPTLPPATSTQPKSPSKVVTGHEQHPNEDDSDSEDENHESCAQRDRELNIMRKVMRKWWRLTGLQGHPSLSDPGGPEFCVPWTRAICPQVEGRIRMITV